MDEEKKQEKKFNKTNYFLTLTIIAIFGCFWAWKVNTQNFKKTERNFPVMGTMCQITLYSRKQNAELAMDKIQQSVRDTEKLCSTFDAASELSQLNAGAFGKPFKCSEKLWSVLQSARKAYRLSNGAFDITVRPLMSLWGFYRKRGDGAVPAKKEIKDALKVIGLDKVKFDDRRHTVEFTVNGTKLDLGGFAKGYAVDVAVQKAAEFNIERGVINLGGNIYCFPKPPPEKTAYTVGIRDPRDKKNICGQVQVLDTAMATSGDYERFVKINGRRYGHIMNPKTGWPQDNGIIAVTVLSPSALEADYLSTSVFINGESFAQSLCKANAGLSILIITKDSYKGFGSYFSNFKRK